MTGTATSSRREQTPRRLEVRITDAEFKKLERAGRDNFRSASQEARALIMRGLAEYSGDKARGA
jgi:hypothetical protein